jgi:hypothetical protein
MKSLVLLLVQEALKRAPHGDDLNVMYSVAKPTS